MAGMPQLPTKQMNGRALFGVKGALALIIQVFDSVWRRRPQVFLRLFITCLLYYLPGFFHTPSHICLV